MLEPKRLEGQATRVIATKKLEFGGETNYGMNLDSQTM